MSSYPYPRKFALEERDPEAYAFWRKVCDELWIPYQDGRKKPGRDFAKRCGTILKRSFPWLASDQLERLTDSFVMFVPPQTQAIVGLYRTLLEHWTLSQPPPTREEMTEALNRPDKWPPGMDRGKYPDGYVCNIDGPLPLRDLTDLQCYLVERRDTLMMELIDVPGATDAIEDAKSWLTFWDHEYPTDSSWPTPTTRSEARDTLNRIRQHVENLRTPIGAMPSIVERVTLSVVDDDDKPEWMPSGPRRAVMEKIIVMLKDNVHTNSQKKCSAARIAAFMKPRQENNSHVRTALRELRLRPYELLSPASGQGYYLNQKGVEAYERLQKDRAEKSPRRK